MKYSKQQIEKLLTERDWLRTQPHCKELALIDAELRNVMVTNTNTYYEAIATVYQQEAA